ncbi:hypothetical protein OK006_8926 [Actinobacteria bacterium OK006]|nr:hypothetical protein OK006_8926 [Actinobacteria bacterium OK006]
MTAWPVATRGPTDEKITLGQPLDSSQAPSPADAA